VALLGLLVLSPLLLIAAILIKLTSRGPVLYGDEREGKDGKVFQCWKFRTMVEGHTAFSDACMDKTPWMVRNSNSGTIPCDGNRPLAAPHNIDELPQLINVVAGQMSLIGPGLPLP